jgi:hypothetical protein
MSASELRFSDLTDFILRITERIWEERHIEDIRKYYTSDCRVETPAGITSDVEAVVQSTLETLNQFPDRQLLGEDVIWSEDQPEYFYSSHRIFSTMTHLGEGNFGKGVGKKIGVRTIADCAVHKGQIYEEWLVRDHAAILSDIGLPLKSFAHGIAEARSQSKLTPVHLHSLENRPKSDGSHLSNEDAAQNYLNGYKELFNESALSWVREHYDRAAQLNIPGGITLQGWDNITDFWLGLRASLNQVKFTADHLIHREDHEEPERIALRWTVTGQHEGRGRFGDPSGNPLHLLGISHAELRRSKILREWILLDELAIWQQVFSKF